MEHNFKLAPNKRIYAIGDIHGYPDVLADLHQKIDDDLKHNPIENAKIIYLGDYIDRGPNNAGVIDMVLNRQDTHQHIKHIHLTGNHEDSMLDFIANPLGPRQDWMLWGGIETMQDYGVETGDNDTLIDRAADMASCLERGIPRPHMDFYKSLLTHHQEDDYLFVHAGIMPNVPIEQQTKQDLTFTRSPFLEYEEMHPHYVVHGHTVPKDKRIEIKPNRINLDSGLYKGGPLSCGIFQDNKIRTLESWQS